MVAQDTTTSRERIIELKKLGLSNCQISRELCFTRQYVSRVCRSHGYGKEPLQTARNKGELKEEKPLSISAASNLLGVSAATLRRWADEGRIPCFRIEIGRRDRRFYYSVINRFKNHNTANEKGTYREFD